MKNKKNTARIFYDFFQFGQNRLWSSAEGRDVVRYRVGSHELEVVKSYRYLGVVVDSS